jgi:hypothetical protein
VIARQKNPGDRAEFHFFAKVVDIRQAVTFGKNFQKCLVFLACPAEYKKFGQNNTPGHNGKYQE